MANGWARDGAVQDQIDISIEEAVKRARDQLAGGESLSQCEACGMEIPRPIMPAVLMYWRLKSRSTILV